MCIKYRSVADLASAIKSNLWRIPGDISFIVGIPRSGLLAASMIALFRNLPICTVQELTNGLAPQCGRTRSPKLKSDAARRILLVDDSIWTGSSMAKALAQLSKVVDVNSIVTCAIYGIHSDHAGCDLIFEVVEPPRYFEWNLFHRKATQKMGFDIDGVLCRDPSTHENDDGPEYQQFIRTSTPLITPTHPIGGVASNRLAKYETPTRQWLTECGINFSNAFFHSANNAEVRRSLGDYVSAKAEAYSSSNWILFIESDKEQAIQICRRANKPVYCYENGQIYYPDSISHRLRSAEHVLRKFILRFKKGIVARMTRLSRS